MTTARRSGGQGSEFGGVVDAEALHPIPAEAAIALVDECLGASSVWGSTLIKFRLQSESQSDWKIEVGCWLHTAKMLGYLPQILKRLDRAKQSDIAEEMERNPNDGLHRILHQELVPAMTAYFFISTGWEFVSWEPARGQGVDVDLELKTPNGKLVALQIKGPDQPGHVVGGRIIDGENDGHVLKSVEKAMQQLPRPAQTCSMIVVSPLRNWPMHNWPFAEMLYGRTLCYADRPGVELPKKNLGRFFEPNWAHVSAVTHLCLVRGMDRRHYSCVVFTNPRVDTAASFGPGDFQAGRVAYLEGDTFSWKNGAPDYVMFPEGTKLVD